MVLINDLAIDCRVHKFIDDTTLTETLLTRPHTSIMQTYVKQLQAWTADNRMIINTKKTKEMLLGPLCKSSPVELLIGQVEVDRVAGFKLLGVHITSDLRWNEHTDKICAKASTRLYFLKQLKRAGLAADQLRHFYLSAIRPILEYCSVAVSYTHLTLPTNREV